MNRNDGNQGKVVTCAGVVTMSPLSTRIAIALFVVSLLFRLVAWWVLPAPALDTNATLAYLGGAQIITDGSGFRDPAYPLFTPPLYALTIAASWQLFGKTQIPIILSQILIDSVTTGLVYVIAVTIFGAMVGVTCGILLAIYPFSIYLSLCVGPETYFTFLLALFVLLMINALRETKWRYFGAAGLVLGAATMMRGTTQFLPLFLILFPPIFMQVRRRVILGFLVLMLSFSLALMPWTIRNKAVLNSFIPVASGAIVFLWGASPNFLEIDQRAKDFPVFVESLRLDGIYEPSSDSHPREKERFVYKAGIESYRRQLENDPVGLGKFIFVKLTRLAYSTESGNNHALILGVNAGIYVFAFWGMFLAWQRNIQLHGFFHIIFLYFVILHWVTLPLFRYMVPIMPYVLAFASYAGVVLYERIRTHSLHRPQYSGAVK